MTVVVNPTTTEIRATPSGVSVAAQVVQHIIQANEGADSSDIGLATAAANGLMSSKHFRILAQVYDVVEDGGADNTYDPSTNPSAPDAHFAFAAAMASTARYIRVPRGKYKMLSTWEVTRPVTIVGDGQEYSTGSVLIFRLGITGIMFKYQPAPAARNAHITDLQVQSLVAAAQWGAGQSAIAGATVYKPSNGYGGYKGLVFMCTTSGNSGSVEPTWPTVEGQTVVSNGGAVFTATYVMGFHMKTPVTIERCLATGMAGDGFSVYASTGDGDNANGCLLSQCMATNNIGWGFYAQGADSNACTFINCSTLGNGQQNLLVGNPPSAPRGRLAEIGAAYGGFCDNSFLGNRYVACSAEGNYGYGFLVPSNISPPGGQVCQSTFTGCYVEGGQETAINQKAMWFGGLAPDGVWGSGNVVTNDRCSTLYFNNDTNGDNTGDESYLRVGRFLSQTTLEMGFSQDSYNPLQFGYGVVNGGGKPGWCGWQYGVTSPMALSLAIAPEGPGHVWFGQRAYLGLFQSELKVQRLSSNLTLDVSAAGSDAATTHVPGRDSGTEVNDFATLAGALAFAPKDLNGFTLTVNDNRVTGSEALSVGGFINGTVVINTPRLGASTFREFKSLTLNGAIVTGAVTLQDCRSDVDGALTGSGRILIKGGHAVVDITATGCTGSALRGEHAQYISYAVAASSCTATPVEFFNCQYTEISGAGLTGTNAGAAYGVSLTGGGKHVLTGATITSATGNALDLDGYSVAWATLSAKNHQNAGTLAYWGGNKWVYVVQLEVINNSVDNFDDVQVRDFQFSRFYKAYGFVRHLSGGATGDAFKNAITARAGGGQALATLCATQKTIITVCASANDSVRLMAEGDSPGFGGGVSGEIWNRTATQAALFPPSGKKLYVGGVALAPDASTPLAAGSKTNWLCDDNGDFLIG